MLSKPLVYIALIFQIIGLIWDFVWHWQEQELGEFFEAPHWPAFLGFILLLVAVLQAWSKKSTSAKSYGGSAEALREGGKEPNKDNPYLP